MGEGNGDLSLGYLMGSNEGKNGSNNGGFGDFGGIWGILALLLILGGIGGFGGYGGFGGGGSRGGCATQADLAAGFNNSAVLNNLNDLKLGQAGIQQTLCQGFHGVDMGFNGLSAQLAQCCCDNRAAISDLKYTMASEFCGLGNAMQSGFRDVIDAQNNGTRAILDFLTQDKIATLTAENQSLKFAASQSAQNAFITANQEAQTAELIRRLGRDCPVPAYVVPNPNCCYGNPVGVSYGGQGSGCGCGCGC